MRISSFCVPVAVALLATNVTRGAYVEMCGNVQTFLNSISIPGRGTEKFEEPIGDIGSWEAAITQLVGGDYEACADTADPLGYDLLEYSNTADGQTYYVLVERTSDMKLFRGLGTYVLNPNWCRALNIQAPHPVFEINTRAESIDTFLKLDAAFLQIAGTHRCANSAWTTCSGETSVCYDPGERGPYFESDVAHFVDNFFQPASAKVAELIPSLVSVSVHGFAAPSCTAATNTSFAVVSNGTSSPVDGCLTSDIARAYAAALAALAQPYDGELPGSCNAAMGDPEVEWPCPGSPPCGTTNVQGRAINGSPAPCITSVSAAPLPERFIHLEQQRRLRDPPDNPVIPGISWQITVDTFSVVFPCCGSPGDYDRDGKVDLTDYRAFSTCLAGPGGGLIAPECVCFDVHRDNNIDLADVARFQHSFTGG